MSETVERLAYGFTTGRPNWPGQVEEAELVPGLLVQPMHTHLANNGGTPSTWLVTQTISSDRYGRRVKYIYVGGVAHGIDSMFHLADFNFEPYRADYWNGTNYLRRIGTVAEFIRGLAALFLTVTPLFRVDLGQEPGQLHMAQGMRESLEQGSLSSDPFWRRKAVALEAVEALDKAGYFIGSLMPGGDGGDDGATD